MLMERMIGIVPHLTRADAGADGAVPGAAAPSSRKRHGSMAPAFPGRDAVVSARLKRNNRREWFNAHRDEYEAHVRAADDRRSSSGWRSISASFAPDVVASPKRSLYRIHRDIRFSENKTPYKTHVAAVFPVPRSCRSTRARACTFTSRPTRCGSAAGCTRRGAAAARGSRAHRRLTADGCGAS